MTDTDALDATTIETLPYVRLLALLSESNRPPGGIDTVRRLVEVTHLRPGIDVLHAGCNAGFLSRELARRSGCQVLGIDISPDMAASANARAREEGLDALVRHEVRDMRASQLPDDRFDVVLSGGALAFVDGHQAALDEWMRVVKPYGLLADSELYYARPVPEAVRSRVEKIIQVPIPEYDQQYWHELFTSNRLEPYYTHDDMVRVPTGREVDQYCERMAQRSARSWPLEARTALHARLRHIFHAFNENLSHMGYLVLARRCVPDGAEPALYV